MYDCHGCGKSQYVRIYPTPNSGVTDQWVLVAVSINKEGYTQLYSIRRRAAATKPPPVIAAMSR